MIVNVVVASFALLIQKIMRLHANVVRIDGGIMLFRIVRKNLLTPVLASQLMNASRTKIWFVCLICAHVRTRIHISGMALIVVSLYVFFLIYKFVLCCITKQKLFFDAMKNASLWYLYYYIFY